MKTLTPAEQLDISQRIRRVLNDYEHTAGGDALIVLFVGDRDGMKIGTIPINTPPDMSATIDYLIRYALMNAHNIGVETGLQRASDIMKAPKIEPPPDHA